MTTLFCFKALGAALATVAGIVLTSIAIVIAGEWISSWKKWKNYAGWVIVIIFLLCLVGAMYIVFTQSH